MIRQYKQFIPVAIAKFALHFGSSHAFDRQLTTMSSSPISNPEIHPTFHLPTSQAECHAADIIAAQRAMTFSIAVHVSMGHC